MSRDFQLPGRSPVIACEGMAATSHPLASLAADETLRAGGNAADAAVTAVAVLCVVEPQMTGIGGDCFAMIGVPDRPVWGYNGCGRAGAGASTEMLLAQGIGAIAPNSIHAITVPARSRPGGRSCTRTVASGSSARSALPYTTPSMDFRWPRALHGTGPVRQGSCAWMPA